MKKRRWLAGGIDARGDPSVEGPKTLCNPVEAEEMNPRRNVQGGGPSRDTGIVLAS